MSAQDIKGEFGVAYVRAVAHGAGYFVQTADRMSDADGVDLSIFSRSTAGTVRSPHLNVQVKTTAKVVTEDPFTHDLEVKAYNELCDETWQVPRILVLVAVPVDPASWVSATETELLLRYSGYWMSFRGKSPTTNATTTRISIPRSARFHAPDLRAIMDRLAQGGLP